MPIDVKRDCPIYVNYRPWSSTATAANYQRTTYPGQVGQDGRLRLRLRYLAKFPYEGQYYYMVRDAAITPNTDQVNWGFVPASCFA